MERQIEASADVTSAVDEVVEILRDAPALALGATPDGDDAYVADVHVRGHRGGSIHQDVRIDFEPSNGRSWDLSWYPVGHRRVLPTFHGRLQAAPFGDGATLVLSGSYAPPLGAVGAFGDGLVGHRVARRSLTAFLDDVAARIDCEAGRRREAVGMRPAPYPLDLRDAEVHPHHWIG